MHRVTHTADHNISHDLHVNVLSNSILSSLYVNVNLDMISCSKYQQAFLRCSVVCDDDRVLTKCPQLLHGCYTGVSLFHMNQKIGKWTHMDMHHARPTLAFQQDWVMPAQTCDSNCAGVLPADLLVLCPSKQSRKRSTAKGLAHFDLHVLVGMTQSCQRPMRPANAVLSNANAVVTQC